MLSELVLCGLGVSLLEFSLRSLCNLCVSAVNTALKTLTAEVAEAAQSLGHNFIFGWLPTRSRPDQTQVER